MERACAVLEPVLGGRVSLHSQLALPGFHIFLAHEAFEQEEAASAHWDLQFRQIDWLPEDEPDFSNPVSFTMPVSLPETGGGLNLWELNHRDAQTLSEQQRELKRQELPRVFHPYAIGRMVVHSGLYLHQIAPMTGALPGEDRITFQGHALRCAGHWRLYW
jgi:hypothetical protein